MSARLYNDLYLNVWPLRPSEHAPWMIGESRTGLAIPHELREIKICGNCRAANQLTRVPGTDAGVCGRCCRTTGILSVYGHSTKIVDGRQSSSSSRIAEITEVNVAQVCISLFAQCKYNLLHPTKVLCEPVQFNFDGRGTCYGRRSHGISEI